MKQQINYSILLSPLLILVQFTCRKTSSLTLKPFTMKLVSTLKGNSLMALLTLVICAISFNRVNAQICSSPSTIIYGLTSAGGIYPITISTAVVGSAITPAYSGNAPSQANGLGYNSLNGKFYYFKRNANTSPQEFVSFDPATNTVTILASSPTSNTIHTGCVSANGLGFYTMDVNARLYYYSIALNTWTLITTKFYDNFGTDITNIITTQNSGDIAIDGYGNLWFLTSDNTNYGLYKITAPLPITGVASITAKQCIAPTATTPTGNSFAGFAFNSTGQIILATLSDNKLYRLENNLSLTFLGNLTVSGIGNDLTSCSFPLGVLPVSWQSFTAGLKDNHNVVLNWEVAQQVNNKGYSIEHSRDGVSWETIGFVAGSGNNAVAEQYSFIHTNPANGNHYYRIRQEDIDGQSVYSATVTITVSSNSPVAVWPNPARDAIHIHNESNNAASKAWVFDQQGRLMNESLLQPGDNTIRMNAMPTGTYVVRVQLANGNAYNQKLVKL